MRITKKIREEAALIAACEASNPDCTCDTYGTAEKLGASGAAAELAFQAWRCVWIAGAHSDEPTTETNGRQAVSAEAEALLRTGWAP